MTTLIHKNNFEWLDIVIPKEMLFVEVQRYLQEELHIKISNKAIKDTMKAISSKRHKCIKNSITHKSMFLIIENAIKNQRESLYTKQVNEKSFKVEKRDYHNDLISFLKYKQTISASEFFEIVSDSIYIYKKDTDYKTCNISRASIERMFNTIITDFDLEIKSFIDKRKRIIPTSIIIMYLIPLYTDEEIEYHIKHNYPMLLKNLED